MIPGAFLRQTLTLQARSGEGASGPVFDEAAAYVPARVDPHRERTLNPQGAVEVSDAMALVRGDVTVSVGDRATHDGVIYRVMQATPLIGLTGNPEGYKLLLGRSTT